MHVLEKEIILKLWGRLDRKNETGMIHKCSTNGINETFKKSEEINLNVYF